MTHGICNLSVIPGRAENSDKSEQITQLLFGEHFSVIKKEGNWLYIRCAFDQYECYIDAKQCQEISEETYNELNSKEIICSTDLLQLLEDVEKKSYLPITIGATLPYFDGQTCNLEGYEYNFDGNTTLNHANETKANIILDSAFVFMNAPYLWGGKSALGIDCSGFTQTVFKIAGLKLLRDAYQQAEQGETINFISESQTGDLAFFDNAEGRIIHVGIIIGDGKIIHASGMVRVDKIDHQGIYNEQIGAYSHNLRLIKRIL